MKKISIIVPIYNISNYIEKCVDSILSQSENNYELILVNDGSTDDSLSKIEKYNSNDNVKILSKKNGGLSSARNYGIKHATGEYLMFIDGDDFLYDNSCLKKLIKEINNSKSDIIQYKMVQYYDKKKKFIFTKKFPDIRVKEKIDVLKSLNCASQISVSACDKLIKTSLLKDNNLYFEDGLLSEDVLWSLKLYMEVKTISLLDENIYTYRQQREGSISSTKSDKLAKDLFYIIKYWTEYEYKDDDIKNLYLNIIAYWYLILRVKFKKKNYTREMMAFFKEKDNSIIEYNDNSKVKTAYKLKKIVGFRITIITMKIYLLLKNKGIIKL